MNYRNTILPLAVALLLAAGTAHAQHGRLLPQPGAERAPAALATDAAPVHATGERAPVNYAWAIAGDADAIAPPAPPAAESREYWRYVGGDELARGVAITTTAPGALVLVSPVGPASAPVAAGDLRVVHGGRALAAEQATTALAPHDALAAATGVAFAPGSLGFRLAQGLGSGDFALQLRGADGRYAIHVREPDSRQLLRIRGDAGGRATGEILRIEAVFEDDGRALAARAAGGMVAAPDGREFPLRVERRGDRHVLSTRLPARASARPGLWEAHVFATGAGPGGIEVARDAKIAFEVAAPTARLDGGYAITRGAGGGLHVDLPVEAGSAGRYEVRALLYATAADGALRPVAVAHAADWLPAGKGGLTLVFPADVVEGARAPYELRQLALADQGRMGRLQYHERAVRIEREPAR